jgi:cGMP-dependent protein kinase
MGCGSSAAKAQAAPAAAEPAAEKQQQQDGKQKPGDKAQTTKAQHIKNDDDFAAVLRFLDKVALFRVLPRDELPLIAALMEKKEWHDTTVLFKQGDEGKEFFVVMDGAAELKVRVPNGEEKVITTLKAGDYFGETSIITSQPRTATVVVSGSLTTVSITSEQFEKTGIRDKVRFPKREAVAAVVDFDLEDEDEDLDEEDDAFTQAAKKAKVTKEQAHFIAQSIKKHPEVMDHFEFNDKELELLSLKADVQEVKSGVPLITQGDLDAVHFYVVQKGRFDVIVDTNMSGNQLIGVSDEVQAVLKRQGAAADKQIVAEKGPGECFGGAALLFNAARNATVAAKEDSVVYTIDRFNLLRMRKIYLDEERSKLVGYLNDVPLFDPLLSAEKEALADGMWPMRYKPGEQIIKQGDVGSIFYIITGGTVALHVDNEAVGTLEKGKFFGERAIIAAEPRAATVIAGTEGTELLAISREAFNVCVGPLKEVMDEERSKSVVRMVVVKADEELDEGGDGLGSLPSLSAKQLKDAVDRRQTLRWRNSVMVPSKPEWKTKAIGGGELYLQDLKLICKLGAGGFGVVTLEKHEKTGELFAVKVLNRAKLQKQGMEPKAASERDVLRMVDTRFVIRLFEAYMDDVDIFFVLEPCLGGELFTVLHSKRLFGVDKYAQFYTACVLEAYDHLHQRHIIFRDLKPENVLLDVKGQGKLCDMGLAKFCIGKAYTLCGTPEYMGPEVIKGTGYGKAADWWMVGIFLFELLTSRTPFVAAAPYEICKNIRRGYAAYAKENLTETHLPREPFKSLIPALLDPNPLARLPMQPERGVDGLREHEYFAKAGFKFDNLRDGQMTAPYIPTVKDPEEAKNFNVVHRKQEMQPREKKEYKHFDTF